MSNVVRVAVVSYSKRLDDSALDSRIAALQLQVSEHLAPAWNVDAELLRWKPQPLAGVYGLRLWTRSCEPRLVLKATS